jgi:MFS family permease
MLSLFSDMGHELVTSILPLYLATFGGGAIALGLIEGFSDAASSLLKFAMSFYSDRTGKRKPVMFFGYLLTALLGFFAFATAWWQLLLIRVCAWMGRGARGPVRDAMLSESVPVEAHGRAFGFEGAMDTLGAVIGPAIALSLIGILSLRHIFLIAFIPGGITVLIVLFVLREAPREAQPSMKIFASLRDLPTTFWSYARAVTVFGLGNFAHTLLVLFVVTRLTPVYGVARAQQIALELYILHNVVYASASFPAGWLGDRSNKKLFLVAGYAMFGIMCLGFAVAGTRLGWLIALFVLAGLYVAIVDAMERAIAADLLPSTWRAVGFGALATLNSVGDLVSSAVVGFLWTRLSLTAGFVYGAVLTLVGAVALLTNSFQRTRGAVA